MTSVRHRPQGFSDTGAALIFALPSAGSAPLRLPLLCCHPEQSAQAAGQFRRGEVGRGAERWAMWRKGRY